MERLMILRVEAAGCAAEVSLNGVPVLRLDATKSPTPLMQSLSVHEYMLAGANRIGVVIDPPTLKRADSGWAEVPAAVAKPRLAKSAAAFKLRLLLPRMGAVGSDSVARTLAQHDWAVAEGDSYETPLAAQLDANLPVSFPRWRWLDAPPIDETPALPMQALALVQRIAFDLSRGDAESLLTATRLRFEELALAYQRTAADETARFRSHIQRLYADKALSIEPPEAEAFMLRRVADGRLVECLNVNGQPALQTAPAEDGSTLAWPLRLAVVEGKFYGLR